MLERYKNIDGLATAWRHVPSRVPGARLHVVGSGSCEDVVRALVRDCPASTWWTRELPAAEIARALDTATVLVLPSRSEGFGRVVVEAFCRARPVIGARVGGIVDLVDDGVNGVLVDPASMQELVGALERVLGEPSLARDLGAAARAGVGRWLQTPEELAARTRTLVTGVLA